jgi:hypothetical protein
MASGQKRWHLAGNDSVWRYEMSCFCLFTGFYGNCGNSAAETGQRCLQMQPAAFNESGRVFGRLF